MKYLPLMALTGALVAPFAFAQTSNVHDGNWEVTISFPSKPIVADLVVSGDTGMFRSHFGGGKNNACGSKETPVVVKVATPDELKITIEYSKVLNGCHDLTLDAKRVDEVTFKGTWPDTRQGTLETVLVKKK